MKFRVVFVSKSRGENGFRKILRDLRRDLRSVHSRRTFVRFDILAGASARFGPGGVEICERLKRSAVGFRSGDFASVGCETLRRDGANGVFTGVA